VKKSSGGAERRLQGNLQYDEDSVHKRANQN